MAKETKVDFQWLRPVKSIINEKVLHNDKTLLFMASTWNRLYDPFVPMDTGLLAHDAVDTYVEGNAGIIHHKAPYAAAVYHAKGRNFNKEKHPLATSYWDEAAKKAGKKDELIRDVQEFIKRGGGG